MLDSLLINPKIAYCKINNDYYILNSLGELSYIDGVGSIIWDKLTNEHRKSEIVEIINDIFPNVGADIIKQDVESFLNILIKKNIILSNNEESKAIRYINPGKYNNLWNIAQNKNIPLKVDIEITNVCNLKCKYCFVELDNCKNKMSISQYTLMKLFDELKEMGTLFLTITGGEATLHPDLFQILEYAIMKKFCVRILSNGIALDENKLHKLNEIASKGLLSIDFSIHSLKSDKFDNFTQVPGSFFKFMRTIEDIKQYDIPVSLVYNVTKYNVDELENIKKFAKINKFYLNINPIIYPTVNTHQDNSNYYMDEVSIKELIQKRAIEPKNIGCFATKAKCWINFNGEVNVCEFIRASAGNIKVNDFKSIWRRLTHGEQYKKILQINKECESCDYKKKCLICPGLILLNTKKEYFCNIAHAASTFGGH